MIIEGGATPTTEDRDTSGWQWCARLMVATLLNDLYLANAKCSVAATDPSRFRVDEELPPLGSSAPILHQGL